MQDLLEEELGSGAFGVGEEFGRVCFLRRFGPGP
jgi:hypothetical protein